MNARALRLLAVALSIAASGPARAADAHGEAPLGGDLVATRLDATNLARLRVGGMHAVGGLGDWALSNGTLCAVIADVPHEVTLSERGGVLVDVGHCGRDDDELAELVTLFNLSQSAVPVIDAIDAKSDGTSARITTRGALGGLGIETTYRVDRERPLEIEIHSRISRREPGTKLFLVGDVMLHPRRAQAAFGTFTRDPSQGVGFAHPEVDRGSLVSMVRAIRPSDLYAFVGSDLAEPGVSYALWLRAARIESRDGSRRAAPPLGISGKDFSALGVLASPSIFGEDARTTGWLDLARIPFLDLEPGEVLVLERRFLLGERADVASVVNRVWAAGPAVWLRGRVDDPRARVHVFGDGGVPYSEVRPDATGAFSVLAPPGSLRLEARAPGGRTAVRGVTTTIADEAGVDVGLLELGGPARVVLPRGRPMRITFLPLDAGAAPARFGDDLLGHRLGDEAIGAGVTTPHVSLGGVDSDPPEIVVRPGRWRVIASRGPEHDVREATIEAKAGAAVVLEIEDPPRAFETPGWISADLHVHSGRSDDSALPTAHRLRSFAAEGAEVLVTTEHDHVFDAAPLLRALGLDGRIATITGVEATSNVKSAAAPHSFGHANVFPLVPRPDAYRNGAPDNEGRRLRDLIAEVRAREGTPLVQLNHARGAGNEPEGERYFTHLSVAGEAFDPTKRVEDGPQRVMLEPGPHGARDLDFEAMEVINGQRMRDWPWLRRDWLSLWLQGHGKTGTANSDSHDAGELVAMPRNYVRVARDAVDGFDAAAFVEAVRAHRVVGTTGPFLAATLDAAGPGDLHRGRTGTLRVAVQAAPWVPVSTLRVLVNAATRETRPCRAGETIELPLDFERDALVTVEVEGVADERYAALTQGSRPFAYTNPILVDADGDGRWTPPGLPDPVPDALR